MSHPVKKSTRARRPPSYLTDNVYRDDEYEAEMNNHINSRNIPKKVDEEAELHKMAKVFVKFLNSVNQRAKESEKKDDIQNLEVGFKQIEGDRNYEMMEAALNEDDRLEVHQNVSHSSPTQKFIQFDRSEYRLRSPKLRTRKWKNGSEKKSKRCQIEKHFQQGLDRQQILEDAHPCATNFPQKNTSLIRINKITEKDEQKEESQHLIKQIGTENSFCPNQKVFKRSSFHIGAAYYMFINDLSFQGGVIAPDQIDPTFYSKKLKKKEEEKILQEERQQLLAKRKKLVKRRRKLTNRLNKHQKQQIKLKGLRSNYHPAQSVVQNYQNQSQKVIAGNNYRMDIEERNAEDFEN